MQGVKTAAAPDFPESVVFFFVADGVSREA
jgi:hypothetical protein